MASASAPNISNSSGATTGIENYSGATVRVEKLKIVAKPPAATLPVTGCYTDGTSGDDTKKKRKKHFPPSGEQEWIIVEGKTRKLEEGTEELTDGGRVRGAGGGGGEKSKGSESSSRVKAGVGGLLGKTIETVESHQSAENERMGRKRQELTKTRRGVDEPRMKPPNIDVETVAKEDSDSDSSYQSSPYSRRPISRNLSPASSSSSDEEED